MPEHKKHVFHLYNCQKITLTLYAARHKIWLEYNIFDRALYHFKYCSRPSNFILALWADHTQAREAWNRGTRMGTVPCVCTSWITMGSVLGSRKNVVTASLSPRRAVMTGCKICGWGASMSSTCWRVLARWGWRAGHSPDRRWATSPGTWPHPGRRQAPDSWVQCLLSQHDLYLPLIIFPITVADLTAEDEELQVHQIG